MEVVSRGMIPEKKAALISSHSKNTEEGVADHAKAKTSGFAMKAAIKGVVAKVAADKALSAFDTPTCPAASWVEPVEKSAGVLGLLLLMGGLTLHRKRPGLSKAMIKFGVVGIAFSVLVPIAASLSPVMASVFGVLAGSIVLVTATLA